MTLTVGTMVRLTKDVWHGCTWPKGTVFEYRSVTIIDGEVSLNLVTPDHLHIVSVWPTEIEEVR